jgi:ribosomal protein S17E
METTTQQEQLSVFTLPEFHKQSKINNQPVELTSAEKWYIRNIFNIVEDHFEVEINSIFHRKPTVIKADETFYRHIAWTACMYIFKIDKSFKLAKYTGGFNHATVNYGTNKIADMLTLKPLEKQVKPVLEKLIEYYNKILKNDLEKNDKPLRQITYEIWKEQFLNEIKDRKTPNRSPTLWRKQLQQQQTEQL